MVKTEVAEALGKLPDRRAYDLPHAIQNSLLKINNATCGSQSLTLKEAVNGV